MAYEQVAGPVGPLREDWYNASIVTAIYESFRHLTKRKKHYKVKEFLPKWGAAKPNIMAQQSIFRRIAAAFQAKGQ